MNNSRNNRWKKPVPVRTCGSCGKTLKQKSRINFPFGRGAKPRRIRFYKCNDCNVTNIAKNEVIPKQ